KTRAARGIRLRSVHDPPGSRNCRSLSGSALESQAGTKETLIPPRAFLRIAVGDQTAVAHPSKAAPTATRISSTVTSPPPSRAAAHDPIVCVPRATLMARKISSTVTVPSSLQSPAHSTAVGVAVANGGVGVVVTVGLVVSRGVGFVAGTLAGSSGSLPYANSS